MDASFGVQNSPYFNISPSSNFTNIQLWQAIKECQKEHPNNIYNLTNFFQGLKASEYVVTSKKDRFVAISAGMPNPHQFTHKLDFHLNRNMLSSFTDFTLMNGGTTTHIQAVLNDTIVYDDKDKYKVEAVNFFISRPNLLPIVALPIISFKLTIYIKSTGITPKLMFNEIKMLPDINMVLNLLEHWYLIDGNNKRLYFGQPEDEFQVVENTWGFLCSFSNIKTLLSKYIYKYSYIP